MPNDTYTRRRKQGLCITCGKPPENRRRHCISCLKIIAEKRTALCEKRIAAQRCVECGSGVAVGKRRCPKCTERERLRVKRVRKKYKDAGLCRYCPSPREANSPVCHVHRESIKAQNVKTRERQIKEHRCTSCGSPLPPEWMFFTCQKCSDRGRSQVERKRRTIFSWYGTKCACCGEAEYYFLTLDHVNSDGAQERALLGGQQQVLNRLWKEQRVSLQYQLLCYNCNCAREMCGTCPHQWKGDRRPASARRRSRISNDRQLQQPLEVG